MGRVSESQRDPRMAKYGSVSRRCRRTNRGEIDQAKYYSSPKDEEETTLRHRLIEEYHDNTTLGELSRDSLARFYVEYWTCFTSVKRVRRYLYGALVRRRDFTGLAYGDLRYHAWAKYLNINRDDSKTPKTVAFQPPTRPHAPPVSRRVRFTRPHAPHAPARKPTRQPHAQTRQTPTLPHATRHVSTRATSARHISARATSAPRQLLCRKSPRLSPSSSTTPTIVSGPPPCSVSLELGNFGNISPAMLNHPIFSRPMMMMILCISSIKLTLKTGTVSTPRLSPGSLTHQSPPSIRFFTPFETAKEVWDYLAERYSSVDGGNESTSWDLSFITFVSTQVRLLLIFTTKCQIYGIIWPSSNLLGPVPLMLLLFMPTETDLVSATFSWLFFRIMSVYGLLFFIAIHSLQLVKLLPNSDLRRLARRLWFISILSLFWPHLSGPHYNHHLSLFGVSSSKNMPSGSQKQYCSFCRRDTHSYEDCRSRSKPKRKGYHNRQTAAVTNSSGPSPDSPSSTLTVADVETIVTQVLSRTNLHSSALSTTSEISKTPPPSGLGRPLFTDPSLDIILPVTSPSPAGSPPSPSLPSRIMAVPDVSPPAAPPSVLCPLVRSSTRVRTAPSHLRWTPHPTNPNAPSHGGVHLECNIGDP
ncbi:hypothetical protein Acr_08g0019360 [Actinidia rufa]|uniref:Uncharacterized protein n=1 Tax=Actinidia rufa TaxID=165716 RepID=A0A7J0F4F1_9ERIC|nr:hypothetical protein Acr_08g0019360 [Actinidia rufa]